MPLAEQFQRVEDEYYRLRGQFAAGRLTPDQYNCALKELMIRDGQGRYWMIGADSGEWYMSDGSAWVKAPPPAAAPPAGPAASPAVAQRDVDSPRPVAAGRPPAAARDEGRPQPGTATAPAIAIGDVVRYGGFWRRVVAYVIDGIALSVLNTLVIQPQLGRAAGFLYDIFYPLLRLLYEALNVSPGTSLPFIVTTLLGAAYFTLFWALVGRTPGQLLLGMKVVTGDGRRPGIVRSFIRYLALVVSAIPLALGLIWVGIDSRKQGWHDKIAGTFVVRS